MNHIFFLFLLFCMLFILEHKAINILISFVGIIITLAIELAYNKELVFIEGEYFSYILILVQVSALTILFGFIIMLYPTLPIGLKNFTFSLNNKLIEIEKKQDSKIMSIPNYIIYIFKSKLFYILIFCYILYLYIIDINIIYNYLYTFFNPNYNYLKNNLNFIDIEKFNHFSILEQNTDFLRKLGLSFYTNNNIIIQFIILTIILLFAIIALFFLIKI